MAVKSSAKAVALVQSASAAISSKGASSPSWIGVLSAACIAKKDHATIPAIAAPKLAVDRTNVAAHTCGPNFVE